MSKRTIEDVLGAIKVPVRAVRICMDADLQAEHDDLTAELDLINRESGGKMADSAKAREVADQIRDIERRMRESEVTFKFRGLTKGGLHKIEARFPPPDPNPDNLRWNVQEGAFALLSASAIEPAMSEDEARRLLDLVSQGHADRLVGAAYLASTGSTQVPFSVRASALTGDTASN